MSVQPPVSGDSPSAESRRLEYALPQRVFWWFATIVVVALISLAFSLLFAFGWTDHRVILILLAVSTVILIIGLVGLLIRVRKGLMTPLVQLGDWASNIRQGDFSARLPAPRTELMHSLAQDINRLSEWLESLAQERERELQSQRDRIEERTRLANELHDSLAQTLASLKYQVRVLDDTLRQDSEKAIWQEMERIEDSIDEANVELRELIAHFRAPLSGQGLVFGIQRLISRFRKETGTTIVLQNQADEPALSSDEETQLLRIVQEALANVRKHSEANLVRVLLSRDTDHQFRIIIEDDGEGMSEQQMPNESDHHFGLAIMRERAASVGAELVIESEPGEGTRVLITMNLDRAIGHG